MKHTKAQVKAALVQKQKEVVANLEEIIAKMRESSDIDEDDSASLDDFSQIGEAEEMLVRMEQKLEGAIKSLNILEEMPLEKNETVDLGALVETDSLLFYIGLALPKIELDGDQIHSISTSSPIFEALAGKKKGETVDFNQKKFKIKSIA